MRRRRSSRSRRCGSSRRHEGVSIGLKLTRWIALQHRNTPTVGTDRASGQLRFGGLVLAGGRASRYGGIAKGMIRLPDGRTIVQRLVEELAAAGVADVVLATHQPHAYAEARLPTVADQLAGIGPLGGIEAGLAYYHETADAVVVLPCDLPSLGRAEILRLTQAFAASNAAAVYLVGPDGRDHPLCAVVATGLGGEVAQRIADGERRVMALWRALGGLPVATEDEWAVYNVNTPGDLAAWWATYCPSEGIGAHATGVDRALRPSPPAPLPGERGARAERGRGEGVAPAGQEEPAGPMLAPMPSDRGESQCPCAHNRP